MTSLGTIRFIDFEDFKRCGHCPRYPDEDITSSLTLADRDISLLIFISHCWLCPTDDNWYGRPHPDNEQGDKFKLCVEGIDRIKNYLAPKMSKCYVWIDFGCLHQDNKELIKDELERYDEVVRCCDAIFTPIVDPHHIDWKFPSTVTNWFVDYKAKAWCEGEHAFLNRGWCRIEMLYAGNIPVLGNESEPPRHTLFEHGLAYHCSENRRPHFLYGSKEMSMNDMPGILPPLQDTYLEKYHPLKGKLTQAADEWNIKLLLRELKPYMDANKERIGYEGETNDQGQPHGVGVMRYAGAHKYEGEWVNGVKHGHGVYRYANGNKFEGEFREDKMCGYGEYLFANGNVHRGMYENDEKNGSGTLTYFSDGKVFDGYYRNNRRHGWSVTRMKSGEYKEELWDDGTLVVGK